MDASIAIPKYEHAHNKGKLTSSISILALGTRKTKVSISKSTLAYMTFASEDVDSSIFTKRPTSV